MILYGRNLSPYVRRVAVWLGLQGRAVETRPLATAEDFEAILAANPVGRVPTLELDDGTRLIEAWAICDWLDDAAPERRLVPAAGPARRETLQRLALASATADKAVALVYDRNRRPEALHWADWIARLTRQVAGGLAAMEAVAPEAGFFGGDAPDGADVGFVCAFDFIGVMHPEIAGGPYPRLAALSARANALASFADTRP